MQITTLIVILLLHADTNISELFGLGFVQWVSKWSLMLIALKHLVEILIGRAWTDTAKRRYLAAYFSIESGGLFYAFIIALHAKICPLICIFCGCWTNFGSMRSKFIDDL